MGQDVSSPIGLENIQNSSLSPADISIPISLRPVLPFLEEAQRNLWYVSVTSPSSSSTCYREWQLFYSEILLRRRSTESMTIALMPSLVYYLLTSSDSIDLILQFFFSSFALFAFLSQ